MDFGSICVALTNISWGFWVVPCVKLKVACDIFWKESIERAQNNAPKIDKKDTKARGNNKDLKEKWYRKDGSRKKR